MKNITAMLQGLTHDDLRAWAGDKIFERGKNYVGSVSQLFCTEDDGLAAWVKGTRKYATWVGREPDGEFEYSCTCPYDGWGPCKHVVALLFKAAEELNKGRRIPLLDVEHDLSLALSGVGDEEDDSWEDEEPERASAQTSKQEKGGIKRMLEGKSREELLALLVDLAVRHPEVERTIRDAELMAKGDVKKIIRALRKEIQELTAEPFWHDPWEDEGDLPDFSRVQERLRKLLKNGHADAVLEVGEELWKQGLELVEHTHDDGETGTEISECMNIVLQALPKSSLKPAQQLLWTIQRCLEDDYCLLDDTEKLLHDPRYTKGHWQDVAKELEGRLQDMAKPKSASFSRTSQRNEIVNWLIEAYEHGGSREKVIPLLESQVAFTRNYAILVDALLAVGEREKARRWCIRGFNETAQEYPGTSVELQKRLREIAEEEGRLDLAAAYRAEDFFDRPSPQTYTALRHAAERLAIWSKIKDSVLGYLRTGQRPDADKKPFSTLPKSEVQRFQKTKHLQDRFPNLKALIDIAILEKRHDDVVTLYQELNKTKRRSGETDRAVALAVAETHPDVALRIWKMIVDSLIAEVKPKAYQEAAGYLRRMLGVYEETGRLVEWRGLINRLRVEHKAKRRLMEVLDNLGKNKKLLE